MSSEVVTPQSFPPPHLLQDPYQSSDTFLPTQFTMNNRKRKADDDASEVPDSIDRMSSSPSPRISSRPFPHPRIAKRPRTNISGRKLALPRLLETLSAEDMRAMLRSVCERHPELGQEVASTAPRPSVASVLSVLRNYEIALRNSFPYGDRPTSDYAYNRVKQHLIELLDASKDYTPQFLPPTETQAATSLEYLDGATNIIHNLPDWDTYQHARHKQDAYEDISRAWALVIREAAKKGGGFQIQYGGWDQKLVEHDRLSGGKMHEAIAELKTSLGWLGTTSEGGYASGSQGEMSIRDQLMSGAYGNPIQVGSGQW